MKNYKALMVKNATHKKIAVAAKENSLTIDQFLNDVLIVYKIAQLPTPPKHKYKWINKGFNNPLINKPNE